MGDSHLKKGKERGNVCVLKDVIVLVEEENSGLFFVKLATKVCFSSWYSEHIYVFKIAVSINCTYTALG